MGLKKSTCSIACSNMPQSCIAGFSKERTLHLWRRETDGQDVEHTLLQIIGQQGQMTDEEAVHYLKQMQQDQRYRKDVY